MVGLFMALHTPKVVKPEILFRPERNKQVKQLSKVEGKEKIGQS